MASSSGFASTGSGLSGAPKSFGARAEAAVREPRMPLYLSLAQRLNQDLRQGRWSGLDALPSERALSCMMAVSRETACKALNVLRERGLLTRRQGSGSYVTAAALGAQAPLLTQAAPALPQVLHRAQADELLALGLSAGSQVIRRRLLHLQGPHAMSELCLSSLPFRPDGPMLPPALAELSDLGAWFEAQGLGPTRLLQRVGVQAASAEQAEALAVPPGTALLHILQIRYSAAGQALELCQRYRCGEAAIYSAELRRNLKP
ncbi:hypothetical protein DBR47_07860 [Paucibacter sp. KBW04]|uniref:GntR family transcriptional regulator n=1 Tax=Paucibacter sp. KBW04 TaxID=2153361 RepID=UPI000F5789C2|nr:GntR family transcriptional regulator [Paucibacter sp. KBW04]RQO61144.1 hypothetical protein DBR47_07860 [Paucibacter sp. KBW04]